MKCPHCQYVLGERNCSVCGSDVLNESNFCHHCGTKLILPDRQPLAVEESDEIDLSRRILCSDGTCIGVINEQGVCKVCGKPYASESQ